MPHRSARVPGQGRLPFAASRHLEATRDSLTDGRAARILSDGDRRISTDHAIGRVTDESRTDRGRYSMTEGKEAARRQVRAPLRQRSRRRWAVTGGVAACWLV